MRKNKRTPRISEKQFAVAIGDRPSRSPKNGIRKTGRSRGARKVNSNPSKGSGVGKKPVQSAIERIAGSAPCYIHNGSGVSSIKARKGLLHPPGKQSGTATYHKKKTRKDAVARCKDVNLRWRTKLMEYAGPLLTKASRSDRRQLKCLLGRNAYAGPIRASDLQATRKFGLICVDVVHSYWLAVPGLKWMHITLFADEFNVSERKPDLALKRLKGKAYKEIQELGLNALIWIDIDPVPNYPQDRTGGTFMFHVHALAFTDREFNVDAARQKLKRSRSWSCRLRAEPTDITEITPRKGTPAWWAHYGAKPPHRAKRYILRSDGTERLRWTDKGYRPQIALRLAEGLAQLAILDTLFAVGEGKDLREEIRKRLMAWHRGRWPDQRRKEASSVGSLFKRLWGLTRVATYRAWGIVGSSL